MNKKELLRCLEVHAGNEWRALSMAVDRLPITQEQKDNIIESILATIEAHTAYATEMEKKKN